jgi:integrase
MLAEAVDDRLLESSPFANVKAGSDIGGQKHHVDVGSSKRILEACPDVQWRCVFALARWGGLRRDSEIQRLKWTEIDWAAERLRAPCT